MGLLTTNSQPYLLSPIQFPYLQLYGPKHFILAIFQYIINTPQLNNRFCCAIAYETLKLDENDQQIPQKIVRVNRFPIHTGINNDIVGTRDIDRVGLTFVDGDTMLLNDLEYDSSLSGALYSFSSFPLFNPSTDFHLPKMKPKQTQKINDFLDRNYAILFICDTIYINNDMFKIFVDVVKTAS